LLSVDERGKELSRKLVGKGGRDVANDQAASLVPPKEEKRTERQRNRHVMRQKKF
jgi:hypothetical protein